MKGRADIGIHVLGEALERLVDVQRHRAAVDRQSERNPRVVGRRTDAQSDRGEKRIRFRMEHLDGLTGPDGAFDVDRRRFTERDVDSVVARQRRLDDLFLYLAVQRDGDLAPRVVLAYVDQRILLGELLERDAKPLRFCRIDRRDHRFECRWRKFSLRSAADGFADGVPDSNVSQSGKLRDLACGHRGSPDGHAAIEDLDRRHLSVTVSAELHPVAGVQRAGEHANEGDLLSGGSALDLEDRPGSGRGVVARSRGQQLHETVHQRVDPRSGDRRATEDGMNDRLLRLSGQRVAQSSRRNAAFVSEIRGDKRVVTLGENVDEAGPKDRVLVRIRCHDSSACPLARHACHRNGRQRQPIGDVPQHAVEVGADAIDLVHEHERRNAQALKCPHQNASLRLHALHGRDNENRAVKHVQHAFDLGDEVWMARRVDQVDHNVVDRERHDRRLDRDPALLFER